MTVTHVLVILIVGMLVLHLDQRRMLKKMHNLAKRVGQDLQVAQPDSCNG